MTENKIENRAKSPDHYWRKVRCPICGHRLMDVCSETLDCTAEIIMPQDTNTYDMVMKCDCRKRVGITVGLKQQESISA